MIDQSHFTDGLPSLANLRASTSPAHRVQPVGHIFERKSPQPHRANDEAFERPSFIN
jgi:hypothetical protein